MPKRDFLAIPDFTRPELVALLALAARMKDGSYTGKPLAGMTLGMIFAKSSTRTRVSFRGRNPPVRGLVGEPTTTS